MRNTNLIVTLTVVLSACALVVACSSKASGTGGPAMACAFDYSGRWNLSGTCTNTSCDVSQNGCGLSIRCDDGAQGSGSLSGGSATISGLLGSGDSGVCSVTFDTRKGFTMSCSPSLPGAQPCSGTGSCEEGSCGKAFPTGSSSGSSGSSTLPCTQKVGADTDEDCAGQAGKPRKLDCNAPDTASAVTAGCTPTKAGDSDVCCPLTVSGTPEGMTSGGPVIDASPPAVTCSSTAPQLFPLVPGSGPFCSGVTGGANANRCNRDVKCCDNLGGSRLCGATCPTGYKITACFNSAECPAANPICCGKGTPDPTVCSYLTIRGYNGSICSTACRAGEFVACADDSECGGKTCTAAYLMNSSETATLGTPHLGACR